VPSDLDALRSRVLADPALQERLLAEPDRARFVALVREVARADGLEVTEAEVEEALGAARRHHRDRWV
jgi:hypothetical protein